EAEARRAAQLRDDIAEGRRVELEVHVLRGELLAVLGLPALESEERARVGGERGVAGGPARRDPHRVIVALERQVGDLLDDRREDVPGAELAAVDVDPR